jgi:hypothetical protein
MSHPRRALRLVLILLSGPCSPSRHGCPGRRLGRGPEPLEGPPRGISGFVDAVEPGIMTALTRACLDGREDCALYLIGKGASLGSLSRGGWFPLNAAVHAGKAASFRPSWTRDGWGRPWIRPGERLDGAEHGRRQGRPSHGEAPGHARRRLLERGRPPGPPHGRGPSGRKDVFRWASGLYSEAQMRRLDSRDGAPSIGWRRGTPSRHDQAGRGRGSLGLVLPSQAQARSALRDAEGRSPEELALASGRKRLAARLK